ncbi:MAG: ParA family protein [Chloroflexota bacterium]
MFLCFRERFFEKWSHYLTHGGIQHDDPYTNHKGGVGKSTSATNIALGIVAVLRQAGAKKYRVLLIDTDSQAHATLVTTGRNNYGTEDSLYAVLMADRQVAPHVNHHPKSRE